MTLFDLEKEDMGDWYTFFSSKVDQASGEVVYDEPEEGAAEFRIRSVAKFWEERRAKRKKEYKMVLNPSTRQMERVGYYEDLPPAQEKKENEDSWDYAITGIRNAFSAPDVPIECNRENKLKLLEIPVFIRFAGRVFQMMAETGITEKETSEKN